MSRAVVNHLFPAARCASALRRSSPAPFVPLMQARNSSHSPMGTESAAPRKKITLNTLRALHRKNEPISMITAHEFPTAHVADHAGIDVVLVGDSLAMVAMGMEDTSEVTLEDMLVHCRSVARATKSAFTVQPSFVIDLYGDRANISVP